MVLNYGFLVLNIVGGLIFKLPGSNLQYVTSITFLLTTYSKYMSATKHTFNCGNLVVTSSALRNLAKRQVYLLEKPCWKVRLPI